MALRLALKEQAWLSSVAKHGLLPLVSKGQKAMYLHNVRKPLCSTKVQSCKPKPSHLRKTSSFMDLIVTGLDTVHHQGSTNVGG